MTELRRAVPDEWPLVRGIRLRALASAPEAYNATLEQELPFTEDDWRRRIAVGAWFLALEDGTAVGSAAAVVDDTATADRHLFAVWVERDRRGSPLAAELVEAVCRWAAGDGADGVTLWVTDDNARARRLYERLGFRGTGARQPVPSAPEVGEELLRRAVGPHTPLRTSRSTTTGRWSEAPSASST